MECLIVIPARGGSKGIPRKNLALLGGGPLIEHTIKAAIDAGLPGRICLSTDDEEIRAFGRTFPIEVPFLRPSSLAQDGSGMLPVLCHAVEWYKDREGFSPTFVVLLQPTCPFRGARNIREAYQMIIKEGGKSLISVNPVNEHPCEYVVREGARFSYVLSPPERPGRQNFPEVFFINGAIYITRTTFMLEQRMIYDETALLYLMHRYESLDIDEPEDLELANWLFERNKRMGAANGHQSRQ